MTIKEIARLSGVSTGTVDRIIHNRGYVSGEKKETVEKIIKEYGFTPNTLASHLKTQKEVVVGFLTPLLSSEGGYWSYVYLGAKKAQEDLKDYNFHIKAYEYDRSKIGSFSINGEKMVNDGIQNCIIIAKCIEEAQTFLSAHPELKYVLVDSAVPNTKPLSIIGQDSKRGGLMAGRLLNLLSPNNTNYLTFSFRSSSISKHRIEGFKEYFQNIPSVKIIEKNADGIESLPSLLKEVLENEQFHLGGIFVPFFAGFLVSEELKKIKIKNRPKLITYDLIPENRKALEDGELDCILSQRPVYQGYSAVHEIYRSQVQKIETDAVKEVQIDIIFKENLPDQLSPSSSGRTDPYCMPATYFG